MNIIQRNNKQAVMELPTLYRASSVSSCAATSDSIEDLFLEITSFDDSFIKKNSDNRIFDTSSEISADYENYSFVKSSQESYNEINIHSRVLENENKINETTKKYHYKSLLSMIKILKKFSLKKTSIEAAKTNGNILRRPREYVYVKGMSGLTIRVEKVPSSMPSKTFYHRCYV